MISLILPAYNEKGIIAENIDKTYSFMKTLNQEFELIIGDDGSTDGQWEIIQQKAKEHKEVKGVRHTPNQGKGSILNKCFIVAKGEIVAFIDADLTIDISLLPDFIEAINNGSDIAIASKHHKGAKIEYPLLRRLSSKIFNALTKSLFKVPIYDFQCGFKAFRRDSILSLLPANTGWLWDTEILVKAYRKGYKISEFGAVVKADKRASKVRMLRDSWKMFKGLMALRKQLA